MAATASGGCKQGLLLSLLLLAIIASSSFRVVINNVHYVGNRAIFVNSRQSRLYSSYSLNNNENNYRNNIKLDFIDSEIAQPFGSTTYEEHAAVSSTLSLDDFDQIIDALSLFRKVYGTEAIIPTKFEVPSSDMWPSQLHGLRLGRRLERIMSNKVFFGEHPEKVAMLSALGVTVETSTVVDEWELVYQCMVIYKEKFGDLRIANKFAVPDEEPWPKLCRNMKLGVKVSAIRSSGRYVRGHPARKVALDAMSFEWRLRDHQYKQQLNEELFEQVYDGLVAYKRITGDDINYIPLNFTIPEDNADWPAHTWKLRLGQQLQMIREQDRLLFGRRDREQRLLDLGFEWEVTGRRQLYSKKRFENVYSVLLVYKQVYGDLLVPQVFVVPDEAPWPEESWGLKLGARVNAIRSQGALIASDPDRRERLNDIGFVWELPQMARKRKKITENMQSVEPGFEDEYSVDAYDKEDEEEGSKTGDETSDGAKASGGSMPSRFGERAVLDYDPSRIFEPVAYREIAAEAMRTYMQDREMSPDVSIRDGAHFEGKLTPQEFNRAITRAISDEDIAVMKEMGYRILEFGRFHWDDVIDALTVYRRVHGNADVPIDYVLTEELIQEGLGYSEGSEGLLLGEAVAGVRLGDIDGLEDDDRFEQLEALDFEWGDMSVHQRYRFVPLVMGLRVFRHLNGYATPDYDYVVPDEPQWPYWMCGMPLGRWAAVARVQQKMMEEHYPNRYDMLNSLGFFWWFPVTGLDDKYYLPIQESLSKQYSSQ